MKKLLVVTIAAATLLSACDYASRKDESQSLVHAARRLDAVKTGTGSFAVGIALAKNASSPGLAGLASPTALTSRNAPPVDVRLSFADHMAWSAPAGPIPESVFVGPLIYLKRAATSDEVDSQFGFRAWSRLDFSKIKRKQKNVLGGVNRVNPINLTYIVRLLAGTLSGSVKRLGTEQVAGVSTTHYRMNVDASKAFSRLHDKERQGVSRAFKSDNIKGSVFKDAEAWIGADGLPRRFIVHVRQVIQVGSARDIGALDVPFIVTYTVNLGDFGAPVTIAAPKAGETANVSSLNALLESVRS